MIYRSILIAGVLFASSAAANNLQSLKDEIRSVATFYATQSDEYLEDARLELEPLIEEISEYNDQTLATDQLPSIVGAWKEIWSNEREPSPFFLKIDRSQVYQVITDQGYFYNFSDVKTPLGTTTGVLRGTYEHDKGLALAIEFTAVKLGFGGLKADKNLVSFASDIENGRGSVFDPPGSERTPNGPVGIRGYLENVYVDDDLRIAIERDLGRQVRAIFVLERVQTVQK